MRSFAGTLCPFFRLAPRIILLAAFLYSPPAYAKSPSADLSEIEVFAFGGVGFSGTPSLGEVLLRKISESPSASLEFLAIFRNSTPEAKCYALSALKKLDPGTYKICLREFRKSPPPRVRVMSGCIVSYSSGPEVADLIESGEYDGFVGK